MLTTLTSALHVMFIESSPRQEQAIVITKQKAEADEALMEALPAVEAASRALENLSRDSLTELKAFTNPPAAVKNLCMQVSQLE